MNAVMWSSLSGATTIKSQLSSTAGSNLAAKVMCESTCAVVHLSSIIFHQSSFKSDNLLQIAGRVYSREERAVVNSWKQPCSKGNVWINVRRGASVINHLSNLTTCFHFFHFLDHVAGIDKYWSFLRSQCWALLEDSFLHFCICLLYQLASYCIFSIN